MIVHGARVAHAARSDYTKPLHTLLRRLTSDLILRLSQAGTASLDDIRALLVVASYSTNGSTFVDIALHAANTIGLKDSLELLLGAALDGALTTHHSNLALTPSLSGGQSYNGSLTPARVYYYM